MVDDRRDGVEKGQPFAARRLHDAGGKRLGSQRPRGDDGKAAGGEGIHPLTHDGDIGLFLQGFFNLGREHIAIHCHRAARRHPRDMAGAHDQAVQLAHFMVQQANRVLFIVVRAE